MKKIVAVVSVVLFLFSTAVLPTQSTDLVESNTIYVDDDNTDGPWDGTQEHPFRFIQDGIDNASAGDTVFVHSGFYNQSRIIIKKSITLVGEDISNTIIDADWNNSYVHTVSIFNTTSVSISGFTIQNGFDGILVSMSRDVMIKNNLIKDNVVGIAVRWNSNNNVICNNEITGNENLGVLVDYVKEDNNNSFLKNNFIHTGGNAIVYYVKCYWKGNYWGDWIGLKFPFLDFLPYRIHTVLGFSNFDWHPAKEPYDIPL